MLQIQISVALTFWCLYDVRPVLGWRSILHKRHVEAHSSSGVRITAIESSGTCHDELQIALAATFNVMKYSKIEIIWKRPRYDSPAMVQRILNTSSELTKWSFDLNRYIPSSDHIIVLSTCHQDLKLLTSPSVSPFKAFLKSHLQSGTKFHVVCLIHGISDPREMRDLRNAYTRPNSLMKLLIDRKTFSFGTVAPHVRNSFKRSSLFKELGLTKVPILVLPLVFDPGHAIIEPDWKSPRIVVQGTLAPNLRNYEGIVSDIETYLSNKSSKSIYFKVDFIGNDAHGSFPIPESMKNAVQTYANLSYDEFFRRIERSVAVLPCFIASNVSKYWAEEYTRRRASSTLATSIVAGVPILLTKSLLRTYTFFDPRAAWERQSHETEIEAVDRILNDPNFMEIYREKARLTRQLRLKLIQENVNILQSLLLIRKKLKN